MRFGRCPLARSFAAAPALASLPPAERTGIEHPSIFGAPEGFVSGTANFPQSADTMRRADADLAATQHCRNAAERNCVPAEWSQLLDQLEGLDLRGKVERVNDSVNRRPTVPTLGNWGRAMYWEAPFVFERRGGQCQDYAIAKYLLLRAAGVPADALHMAVARVGQLGLDHAVLVAEVNGQSLVLDNLTPCPQPAEAATDYRPYYSINETGWWLHFGVAAGAPRVASAAG